MLGSGWDRRYEADPNSGCWLFNGAVDPHGYGRIKVLGKRQVAFAHRLAWAEAYGPIPAGLHVLHRCDTPPCIRPDHLFLGTQADNMHDMHRKGRHAVTITNRKLTDEQIVVIKRNDRPARDIAAEFGVAPITVWQIRSGRLWRAVVTKVSY